MNGKTYSLRKLTSFAIMNVMCPPSISTKLFTLFPS